MTCNQKYPLIVIIEIVYNAIYWMNTFPRIIDGISDTLALSTVVIGRVRNTTTWNLGNTVSYTPKRRIYDVLERW